MASGFYQISEFQGLGTVTVKVPNADQYSVKGSITLPTIPNGESQSQLLVVVNQNGSPMFTGLISARGFEARLNCAANDVITVVMSSAAAVDAKPNFIKSLITVSQGLP